MQEGSNKPLKPITPAISQSTRSKERITKRAITTIISGRVDIISKLLHVRVQAEFLTFKAPI